MKTYTIFTKLALFNRSAIEEIKQEFSGYEMHLDNFVTIELDEEAVVAFKLKFGHKFRLLELNE